MSEEAREDVKWFRWWHDGTTDPKLLRLSFQHRWLWIAILTLASESPIRGSLYVTPYMPCALEDVARKAGLSPAVTKAGIDLMMRKEFGMLELDENGAWRVVNWHKRQPSSGTSTERVRKYRERVKATGATLTGYTKYRDYLMQRDGGACVYCGATENLCIDHMVPVQLGGDDDPMNLAMACKACNSGKSGRTPEMAGYQFTNKATEVIYRANLLRLQQRDVTVSETPSDNRVQITDTEIYNTPLNPPKRGKEEYSADFEEFWSVYPRKVNKKGAYAKWRATLRKDDAPTKQQLIECAKRYAAECKRKGTEQQYILHAATFLGPQERWRDYMEDKPGLVEELRPTPRWQPREVYVIDEFERKRKEMQRVQ